MTVRALNRVSEGNGPIIQPLASIGRKDLNLAGGKGANLGELIQAGFTVPEGFVVTTTAYDLLLSEERLRERITDFLSAADPSGAGIRTAINTTTVPTHIAEPILAAYRQLNRGPVALRSSATAEDLPEAAFAGQQDTYLNIVGEEELLSAVRSCWASLWTERAITYRTRQGVDPTIARMAVVVQRLVSPEFAGVMFTANPVSGAEDEVVIDSSPGLGEAVVSGLVTPDHYILTKHRSRIKEARYGRREVIVRARPDGGIEQIAEAPNHGRSDLPHRALPISFGSGRPLNGISDTRRISNGLGPAVASGFCKPARSRRFRYRLRIFLAHSVFWHVWPLRWSLSDRTHLT